MSTSAQARILDLPCPARSGPVPGPVAPIRTALAVQGWTCDRTPGGMRGSGVLARRAAERFGLTPRLIGSPSEPADLDWRPALERAAPTLAAAAAAVAEEVASGHVPLCFLNRCGTSLATLPALFDAVPDACLVWCDAHGDYNTPETTPTGYLGGLVIAALCGLWDSGFGAPLTPDRVVLVGVRDLDEPERQALARDAVAMVPGRGLDLDAEAVVAATRGRPVVLHVDCDVVDPAHLPAEYRIPDGLHPAAVRRLVRRLAACTPIAGVEVTEFEHVGDEDHAVQAADVVMALIEPLLRRTTPACQFAAKQ